MDATVELIEKRIMPVSYVTVVVIEENVVSQSFLFVGDNNEISDQAEAKLLDLCSTFVSNWSEHTSEDITNILDQGYYELVNGNSICITWPELIEA